MKENVNIRQEMLDILPILEDIKWDIILEKYPQAKCKINELKERYDKLMLIRTSEIL